MYRNEIRLTENELKLKKEVSELVGQLNEKMLQLKQNGITCLVEPQVYNDGQENEFIGMSLQLRVYV